MFRSSRLVAAACLGLLSLCGVGCQQADFGADITNKTPQVVFARLHVKPNDPNGQAVIAAEKRFGPGDRGFIGPVRTLAEPGVFLTIDTYPNIRPPVVFEMSPGTANLEITQEGDAATGTLRLNFKH